MNTSAQSAQSRWDPSAQSRWDPSAQSHRGPSARSRWSRSRRWTAGAGVGLLLLLGGCGFATTEAAESAADASAESVSFVSPAQTHADADDGEYDTAGATTITLADGGSRVSGSGAAVEGDVVTITSAGTYLLSGTLSDGRIVVASGQEGKVRLVLDGVDITSADTSPVIVTEADEVVVILADGSTNTLSDSTASGSDDDTEDAPTATLFSMADLTIAGSGRLDVTGASNDGIGGKDGVVILSGTVTVTATDDGIRGKDYLVVQGGTVNVTAGGDGLKCDNDGTDELGWFQLDDGTVTVAAGDDGVDAVGAVNVASGTLTVTRSTEGLEAARITVAGGTVDVTATDDGLNATDGSSSGGGEAEQSGVLLTVRGGQVTVTAGGDALDSNGSAVITGGVTILNGPTTGGNGILDVNGTLLVNGGTLVAAGTSSMATVPSTDSEQGWLAVTFGTTVRAGQRIVVTDSSGEVVGSYVVTVATAMFELASDAITAGEDYTVYVGDAGDASGYGTSGSVDGLTEMSTVTAGEFAGGSGGMDGGPAGGMGGGPGR
jgi:hypothetical protein